MTRRFDPHRIGAMRIGYSRIGVLNPLFEQLIASGRTVEVTRRKRTVIGTRDSVTGHPDVSWTESTIDAVINLGPSSTEQLGAGIVGRLDGTILTADPIKLQDQIVNPLDGAKYEVSAPMIEKRGREGGFLYRSAGLRKLELET